MKYLKLLARQYRAEGDDAGNGTGEGDDAGNGDDAGGNAGDKPGLLSGAGDWAYAEGVAGEGDRPEWFDPKYKTVEEQAKAAGELATKQGKYGNFFGAPEGDYDLSLPDGVEGDFDNENPLLGSFRETARELGISQSGFDKLLHTYVTHDAGMLDNHAANVAQVAEGLGENGEQIIQDTWQRLSQLLPAEQAKALDSVITSADGVRALQSLIASEAILPSGGGESPGAMSRDELRALKFEKFPEGHPQAGKERYALDAEFRKRVDNLYTQRFPGEDNKEV